MSFVRALGYIVVRGPLEEWKTFATEVLGAQVGAESEGSLRLRLDEHAYRIVIEDGLPEGPASLSALGWETAGEADLNALVASLQAIGLEVLEDPETAAVRDVRKLYTLMDPEGTRLELYYGPQTDHSSFISPRGVRFVTGSMGAGHVFIFAKDAAKTAAFYTEALGFRMTDTITVGQEDAIFLHCNPRHHSIALLNMPAHGIGHLMLEVDSTHDVGRTFDHAQASDSASISIGEHSNDLMLSCYLRTPSGFDIEYGVNGRILDDDDFTVSHYTSPSIWGHHFQHAP